MPKLYEITLAGTYYNQLTINRWNYVMSGSPIGVTGAFAMAQVFGAIPSGGSYPSDTLLSQLTIITSDQWDWQQLTVINPYDDTDFYQAPFTLPMGGIVTGEAMSPVMALGFYSNIVRRDIRRATKRFVGVPEATVQGGGVIVAGAASSLDLMATRLTDSWDYSAGGNSLAFVPAVVKKQKYQTNPGSSDPPRYAYRYIPVDDGGEAAQLDDTAQGIIWDWYPDVRSQVSRQYGRGR